MSLVERGGKARSTHVDFLTASTVRTVLVTNIDRKSDLITDQANVYKGVNKEFASHETVNHGLNEWARRLAHTNTIEGFFSIFKLGMKGVYQHAASITCTAIWSSSTSGIPVASSWAIPTLTAPGSPIKVQMTHEVANLLAVYRLQKTALPLARPDDSHRFSCRRGTCARFSTTSRRCSFCLAPPRLNRQCGLHQLVPQPPIADFVKKLATPDPARRHQLVVRVDGETITNNVSAIDKEDPQKIAQAMKAVRHHRELESAA